MRASCRRVGVAVSQARNQRARSGTGVPVRVLLFDRLLLAEFFQIPIFIFQSTFLFPEGWEYVTCRIAHGFNVILHGPALQDP